MEQTGGGRTNKSEIYPDALCRAMLRGLVKQMDADGRAGSTFKSDDHVFTHDMEPGINEISEVNWETESDTNAGTRTWSRKDYGTSRLMMPGPEGPLWSACINRLTRDLDTGAIIEDRPLNEVKRKREEERV